MYSEIKSNINKNLKIISTWNKDLAEGTKVNVVKDDAMEVK